jgi:hypothetical protein
MAADITIKHKSCIQETICKKHYWYFAASQTAHTILTRIVTRKNSKGKFVPRPCYGYAVLQINMLCIHEYLIVLTN